MRDAARRAGRLLQVGLLMRSVSAYGHVEAVARSGEHGRLLSVATWRLGSYLHADAPDRKAHYGDPSTELMTFDFDFVHWLMGQPQSLRPAPRACRTAGRASLGAADLSGRPSRNRHRQRTDAAGRPSPQASAPCSNARPSSIWPPSAAVRRRRASPFPPARRPRPVPVVERNPYARSSCSVSSTALRAVPTRRCSMPIGPSRRCVCRSRRSKASRGVSESSRARSPRV